MPDLYLDIFSGISGDMLLGALVDLGVPFESLRSELQKLNVPGYHLHVARSAKCGITGVKFDVHVDHEHAPHTHSHTHAHSHSHDHDPSHPHLEKLLQPHSHGHPHGHHHSHAGDSDPAHGRNFADIQALISRSTLSEWVRTRSIAVFRRIAIAEGKIHGHPPDEVHFHEVGAIDSIVDIVGACVALEILGRPAVFAGPVVEGTGFVRCQHGRMPLPAPATLEILTARKVAVTQCDEPSELVTPTGAALLAEFAESFGPLPEFSPERIGYGLGTRDNRTRPNVLRAILGRAAHATAESDWETDTVAVLETNLDDLNPEILGHFVEKALGAGALDVFHTPVHMKKNRPGTLLTVVCPQSDADRFACLILTETSAFGVRQSDTNRRKLRREAITVATPFGPIAVKLGRLDGRIRQATPEFEDCRKAAAAAGVPLREVYDAANYAVRMIHS